jgi:hypothetical protein
VRAQPGMTANVSIIIEQMAPRGRKRFMKVRFDLGSN